jgi:predicted phage terminase large subunit-like protein
LVTKSHLTAVDLARLSPAGYASFASEGEWKYARHLLHINSYILKAVHGQQVELNGGPENPYKFMLFTMPPRHGKSEFISKYSTSWYLGSFPKRKVIISSYEATFAAEWGAKARDVHQYAAPIVFNSGTRYKDPAASHWETIEGGEFHTAGAGGGITGKGAHLFVIDDPVKNEKEVEPIKFRNDQDNWYKSVVSTRLEPAGMVWMIMTRWHKDDLGGRRIEATKTGDENWVNVNLPALAHEDDPIDREEGDPLWPARFNKATLKARKLILGTYFWNALYDQSPSSPGGYVFKRPWWMYYELPPNPAEFRKTIISWDTAHESDDKASWSVGLVMTSTKQRFFVRDRYRAKPDFPDLIRAVVDMGKRYPGAIHLIENEASGKSLLKSLKRQTKLAIIAVNPEGSKYARAQSVTPEVEGGRVYIPSNESWSEDFIEELSDFPTGTFNDQVDAFSQGMKYLTERGNLPIHG